MSKEIILVAFWTDYCKMVYVPLEMLGVRVSLVPAVDLRNVRQVCGRQVGEFTGAILLEQFQHRVVVSLLLKFREQIRARIRAGSLIYLFGRLLLEFSWFCFC